METGGRSRGRNSFNALHQCTRSFLQRRDYGPCSRIGPNLETMVSLWPSPTSSRTMWHFLGSWMTQFAQCEQSNLFSPPTAWPSFLQMIRAIALAFALADPFTDSFVLKVKGLYFSTAVQLAALLLCLRASEHQHREQQQLLRNAGNEMPR